MIIGVIVVDKIDDLAKKLIKIKMITQIKIKNLINKMNTLILIKIWNLKKEDLTIMITIILERETHIIKNMTVGIVKDKEDTKKMAFKKEIAKDKKQSLTLIQIIECTMWTILDSLIQLLNLKSRHMSSKWIYFLILSKLKILIINKLKIISKKFAKWSKKNW